MGDMNKVRLTKIRPVVTYKVTAEPRPGLTVEELAEKIGGTVQDGQVLLAHRTEEHDRWGCLYCLNEGVISVVDTEDELRAHLDTYHDGWQTAPGGSPSDT